LRKQKWKLFVGGLFGFKPLQRDGIFGGFIVDVDFGRIGLDAYMQWFSVKFDFVAQCKLCYFFVFAQRDF
jgi:hypothetical protein